MGADRAKTVDEKPQRVLQMPLAGMRAGSEDAVQPPTGKTRCLGLVVWSGERVIGQAAKLERPEHGSAGGEGGHSSGSGGAWSVTRRQ
jgi:hypothetical protein